VGQLKAYFVSIVTVSLICSVVQSFPLKDAAKDLTKLICGLLMAITVIAPVRNLDFSSISIPAIVLSDDAQSTAAAGEQLARNTLAEIIKTETEAYIQTKAAEMGADVFVTVSVSNDDLPVPTAAVISGSLTAYERNLLQNILNSQLGIAKENLQWIG